MDKSLPFVPFFWECVVSNAFLCSWQLFGSQHSSN